MFSKLIKRLDNFIEMTSSSFTLTSNSFVFPQKSKSNEICIPKNCHFEKNNEKNGRLLNVTLFYYRSIHILSFHLYSSLPFTTVCCKICANLKRIFCFFSVRSFNSQIHVVLEIRLINYIYWNRAKKRAEYGSASDPIMLSWLLSAHYVVFYSQRRLLLAKFVFAHSQFTTSKWFCRLLFA